MYIKRNRILAIVICVSVSLTIFSFETTKADSSVEAFGYIHLDNGINVTQLSNHTINITNDRTQNTFTVNTDQYGFYSQILMVPDEVLYTDNLTIITSYYDNGTSTHLNGSTSISVSDNMRVDPTFMLYTQECKWYNDNNAPEIVPPPHSDEVLIDLYFSTDYFLEGDDVTIYADVKNIGDVDCNENIHVSFLKGNPQTQFGEDYIGTLAVGETKTSSFEWNGLVLGTSLIRARIDFNRNILEVIEDNNWGTDEIIVIPYWGDYDSDGLRNWDEVHVFGTDPYSYDDIINMNQDWIVDHQMICSKATINLNGNLIVQPGNTLTLNDFCLKMDSSTTQRSIVILNQGNLLAYDTTIAANEPITPYEFIVNGGLELINSKISNMNSGIKINSNNAHITGCVLSDANIGLHIENGYYPNIRIEENIFYNILNTNLYLQDSNLILLDNILDHSKLELVDSTVSINRKIHVRVFDSDDSPAQDINVIIPEVGFSGLTDSEGFVRDILVTDFIITHLGAMYIPHRVIIPPTYVSYEGYETQPDISVRANTELALHPAIFTLDGDPSTTWTREANFDTDYLVYDFEDPIEIGSISLQFDSIGIVGTTVVEVLSYSIGEWIIVDTLQEIMSRQEMKVDIEPIDVSTIDRIKIIEPGSDWEFTPPPLRDTRAGVDILTSWLNLWADGEPVEITIHGDPNDPESWSVDLDGDGDDESYITREAAALIEKITENTNYEPASEIKWVMPKPDPRTWYLEIDGDQYPLFDRSRWPGPVEDVGIDDQGIYWVDEDGVKHYPFDTVEDISELIPELPEGDFDVEVNPDGTMTITVTLEGNVVTYTVHPYYPEIPNAEVGVDEEGNIYIVTPSGDVYYAPSDYDMEDVLALLSNPDWTFVGQPSDPSTWRLIDPNGNVWVIETPGFAEMRVDTDGDGIPNQYEQALFLGYLGEDMDEDGKLNGPLDDDTDGDYLTDFEEIEVVFRTNADGNYGPGTWITVDADEYGGLDYYRYKETGTSHPSSVYFAGKTPEWYDYFIHNLQYEVYIHLDGYMVVTYEKADPIDPTEVEQSPLPFPMYSEFYKIGSDPTDKDTDGDTLWDGHEVNDLYTSPIKFDTDNDGCDDYHDPIPLDYDIDRDGYINNPCIADWQSFLSVSHFDPDGDGMHYEVVEEDLNLKRDPSGDFIDDIDMDGDGIDDVDDPDADNDGMSDEYEFDHGVGIPCGWQNPYIYNERYAVLVGGGSTDETEDKDKGSNWDAFWKDPKDMYIALENSYNYKSNNIYLHHWDKQQGDYGVFVMGPSTWQVDPIDQSTWGLGIKDSFTEISNKITKNDFFFFLSCSHGTMVGILIWDYKSDGLQGLRFGELEGSNYPNLETELNKLHFKRASIVIGCCWSEVAIPELYGEDRIVITSSEFDEPSYSWENHFPGSTSWDNHFEFFHDNEHDLDTKGFVYSLKHDGIISLKTAFVDGYNAARHDDFGGGDDTSHAKLDDNGGNNGMNNNGADGIGVRKNNLWELGDDNGKDGFWAYHTYL